MPGHRVVEQWMGETVTTLDDLLRPKLRAVCVGINPSLVSVEVGHYYQGRLGKRFLARLPSVGLIPAGFDGEEDDAAFERDVGFTDIVKRPTARAAELRSAEFGHGRKLLLEKLERHRPELVIFTYKKTAEVLFGSFRGNGFLPGLRVAGTEVFVMPGPYERPAAVAPTLAELALRLSAGGPASGRR